MNTTIAKVIAFELGLLIAILTWMAFVGPPNRKATEPVADLPEEVDDSFANVAPVFKTPQNQYLDPVDYRANDETNGVDTVAQLEAAPVGQSYDQDYGSGSYNAPDGIVYPANQYPNNSIGVYPEPVLADNYFCDTPYFAYAQPQVIIISNNRGSARRHRISPRSAMNRGTVAPRPSRQQPRLSSPRAASRRPVSPRMGGAMPGRGRMPHGGTIAPRRGMVAQASRQGQATRARMNR